MPLCFICCGIQNTYLFIYLSYLNKNVLTFSPNEFSQCEDGSTMESSTHLKKKTREAIDNKCFPVSFSHERHIFDGQLRVQTNFSSVFEWTELVKMT